jgi:hypothetical protein
MEFFREIKNSALDQQRLTNLLTIKRLPELCGSISTVISDAGDTGIIYCLWGEFIVNREELKHGIRFSLPECPNALTWTITTDDDSGYSQIHCTINRQQHDADFIASIQEFVTDWADGLSGYPELDNLSC